MEGIVFIGIQATGKSTFFKERFVDTHIRLNMDMLCTRNRERVLFSACLEAKQALVIDNTNPQRSDREAYISQLKENQFKVVGYYFESRIRDAIQRNSERELRKPIPEKAIVGTSNRLELPTRDEGFDELYFVRITDDGFEVKEWSDEI